MKRFVFLVVLMLTAFVLTSNSKDEKKTVSLTAKVLEINKSDCMSGSMTCYHYVKYQVLNVCDGEEKSSTILVAYISLTTEEIDDLNVGDVVCMKVLRTDKFKKDSARLLEDLKELDMETDISKYKIPTHIGYDYIKNCQCYSKN